MVRINSGVKGGLRAFTSAEGCPILLPRLPWAISYNIDNAYQGDIGGVVEYLRPVPLGQYIGQYQHLAPENMRRNQIDRLKECF